jgi:hypothetical protein
MFMNCARVTEGCDMTLELAAVFKGWVKEKVEAKHIAG